MKIKTYLVILLTAGVIASCQRTLNVDISNEKPLIIMNGIIHPDAPITIAVSKSFSYFDTDSMAPYLPNVSLALYINGRFVEKMRLEKGDSKGYGKRYGISRFASEARAQIGDKIKIEASAPGMETAWAETQIPVPPTIEKVDTATFLTAETWIKGYYTNSNYQNIPEIKVEPFFRNLRLHIGLKSAKSNAPQYFNLQLAKLESTNHPEFPFYASRLLINTQEDPIFANNPQNSIFDALFEKNYSFNGATSFTDKLFKDNAYTLNVSTIGHYSVEVDYEPVEEGSYVSRYKSHRVLNPHIEILITALSPELYFFSKSHEGNLYDDELWIISEPKVTYTNVHNGIGVVGAKSFSQKQIEIAPYPGAKDTAPRAY